MMMSTFTNLVALKNMANPSFQRITYVPSGNQWFVVLDQLRTVDKVRLVKRMSAVSTKTLTAVLATLQEIFAE